MNLVEHAKRELEISGFGDDYDGMIGESVIELVEIFAQQGHSGYSAYKTTEILDKVIRFRPLTELTRNPDEWQKVAGAGSQFPEHPDQWQSFRRPDAFSEDGGLTYILLDEPSDSPYISIPYA